jgi:uncharacterized DUF497 family protein
VTYEWDPRKAAGNLRKHRVAFLEASTVFRDPLAITYPDPDHSENERRYITIGLSGHGRVRFVAHADFDDRIRIISARKATRRESHGYTQDPN